MRLGRSGAFRRCHPPWIARSSCLAWRPPSHVSRPGPLVGRIRQGSGAKEKRALEVHCGGGGEGGG